MPNESEFLSLRQLLADQPESLSWEQLFNLRAKVSELMLGASPETLSVYRNVYSEFTKMLKARAEELGKGKEFSEIENATQLVNESEKIIGQLKATDSGIEYFDILNDPAKQEELAAIDRLMESTRGSPNCVNQMRNSGEETYRIAKSAQAGERLRFRDIFSIALEWIKCKIK
jgi:hypothetical protein